MCSLKFVSLKDLKIHITKLKCSMHHKQIKYILQQHLPLDTFLVGHAEYIIIGLNVKKVLI